MGIELKRMTKQELIDHVDQVQERWQRAERQVDAAKREREIAANACDFAKGLLHDIGLVCETSLKTMYGEGRFPDSHWDADTQTQVERPVSPEVRLLREIYSISKKERR